MSDPVGQIIKFGGLGKVLVEARLGEGGTAVVYIGTIIKDGSRVAVKRFKASSQDEMEELRQRTAFLVAAKLYEVSPLLAAPFAWTLHPVYGVLHVTDLAPGDDFETKAANGWNPMLRDLVQLACAASAAYRMLDEAGFAHGDVSGNNIKIAILPESVHTFTIIDFDNYYHTAMPMPPPWVGQHLFIAAEQRIARDVRGENLKPDPLSERSQIGYLLHLLLLLRHPAQDVMNKSGEFARVMTSGWWPDDPQRGATATHGYPAAILDLQLRSLFRRSFGLKREDRPTAAEWEAALHAAIDRVWVCDNPGCGGAYIVDHSNVACPYCHHKAPTPRLRLPNGRILPITGVGRAIGRADLGGSPTVSTHHVTFHNEGPLWRLTSLGLNGTFRLVPSGSWIRLPDGTPTLIRPGDRLRIADTVEVVVESAA